MNTYTLYQIDAFTSELFKGNPAAIVPLPAFLPDALMQNIAAENNLSETAFIVQRSDNHYDLRWFTPTSEIEFCGHATIASAHALIHEMGVPSPIVFHTQIGELKVSTSKAGYTLCAPNYPCVEIPISAEITAAFGINICGAYRAHNNLYIELETPKQVHEFTPDMPSITKLLDTYSDETNFGVSIMAQGSHDRQTHFDFVSRHFCPLHGIPEDPVTGSVHSALAPFWAQRLGKTKLLACQCSPRSGVLHLDVFADEVQITGHAITYMQGQINIG
ncbi:MAG: phenazine biosynthesis protein PhzF family [Robiginitomaculum sp.]|nr:MAG: phenazine biosynthesis protein PhzF family [Robiginitomaculum sp.]